MAGNPGEPIMLSDVELIGIAAESVQSGGQAKIWTRLAITSDDVGFHLIVEGIGGALQNLAQQAGASVNLTRANTIVMVVRPNKSAELWVDAAATTMHFLLKRPVDAGTAIFESDVADITGMWFPALSIDKDDRLLVLFREGWSFGLYYDLTPDIGYELDAELARRSLGRLKRVQRYRHLYSAIANADVFDRLVAAGWFPFVELLAREFQELVSHTTANFPLDELENKLLESFAEDRLNHMLARWSSKPHLQSKMPLLEAAVTHFKAGEAIACIKIAITEIEGVLRTAFPAKPGTCPSVRDLLKLAVESAIKKSGEADTLLLPEVFARYLSGYTFARFEPSQGLGQAGSRHAVGHGAAQTESYTQAKALQVLLTIDQLVFYL